MAEVPDWVLESAVRHLGDYAQLLLEDATIAATYENPRPDSWAGVRKLGRDIKAMMRLRWPRRGAARFEQAARDVAATRELLAQALDWGREL